MEISELFQRLLDMAEQYSDCYEDQLQDNNNPREYVNTCRDQANTAHAMVNQALWYMTGYYSRDKK
jgi:oligoendopeptidase F